MGTPAAGSRPSPGNLAAAGRRRGAAGCSSSSSPPRSPEVAGSFAAIESGADGFAVAVDKF